MFSSGTPNDFCNHCSLWHKNQTRLVAGHCLRTIIQTRPVATNCSKTIIQTRPEHPIVCKQLGKRDLGQPIVSKQLFKRELSSQLFTNNRANETCGNQLFANIAQNGLLWINDSAKLSSPSATASATADLHLIIIKYSLKKIYHGN